MFDQEKLTAEAREYFESMSPLMRETLVQTGMPYTSKEELESFAQRHETE